MYRLNPEQILRQLPPWLESRLNPLPDESWAELEEIRLKPDCPLLLRLRNGERFLTAEGALTVSPSLGEIFPQEEMDKLLSTLSGSSLYAMEEELRNGYMTIAGGHRVGFSGRGVLEKGRIRTLRDISSVNIRLARAVLGVGQELLPRLLDGQGNVLSTLIISPPGVGKTTLLRDLARAIADGEGVPSLRVGIVDERSEIAAMWRGKPQLPVGLRSDVLDGCPKAEGLMLLLRSMSPQVLICDELGRPEDVSAMREAANAGVSVLATAHGLDGGDLLKRPVFREMLTTGCFHRLVILSRRLGPGTVERVYDPC